MLIKVKKRARPSHQSSGHSGGGGGGGGGGFSFGGYGYADDFEEETSEEEEEEEDHEDVSNVEEKPVEEKPIEQEEVVEETPRPVKNVKEKSKMELKMEKMREKKRMKQELMNQESNGEPAQGNANELSTNAKPPRHLHNRIITAKLMDSATSSQNSSSMSTRPNSGFTRPTSGASRPTSGTSRPTSGTSRPTSGTSRPTSAVIRKSIPSKKDSLLSRQSVSDNGESSSLYGNAEDDELEKLIAPNDMVYGTSKVESLTTLGSKTSVKSQDQSHARNLSSKQSSVSSINMKANDDLSSLSKLSINSNHLVNSETRPTSKDSNRSLIDKLPPINANSYQSSAASRPISVDSDRPPSSTSLRRPLSSKSLTSLKENLPNSAIPSYNGERPFSGKSRTISGLSQTSPSKQNINLLNGPTDGIQFEATSSIVQEQDHSSKHNTSALSLPTWSDNPKVETEPRSISAHFDHSASENEPKEEIAKKPLTTERSLGAFTNADASDDELMELAKQLDDGIYDPLASLSNMRDNKTEDSRNASKAENEVMQMETDDDALGLSLSGVNNEAYDHGEEMESFLNAGDMDNVLNDLDKNMETTNNNIGQVNSSITKLEDAKGSNDNPEIIKETENAMPSDNNENMSRKDLALDFDDGGSTATRTGSAVSNFPAIEAEELFDNLPKWHPPWQLKKEIVAHQGAIPELVVDPSNRWFATGSVDKTIRLWDINTGVQKLVIKAHKQAVRALAFGTSGHRWLYSTGDDRQLLCHDVEVNRIVSKFKGQPAVLYDMAFFSAEQLLMACGRDKLIKVFDTRTMKVVRSLRGHTNTVSCVTVNERHKQIISGSHDSNVRVWDIGDGRCMTTLYGHKKSVRALTAHPDGTKALSASSEAILAWELPLGDCVQEIKAKDIAINSITMNEFGVVTAGGSNGYVNFWDFESGFRFQRITRSRVYDSYELPITVFASKFDQSGKILLCADACNVVKIYKEAFSGNSSLLVGPKQSTKRSLSKNTPLHSVR